MEHIRGRLDVSERRVCRVIGQPRSTQRDDPVVRSEEAILRSEIIRLSSKYGRYGYRQITGLLKGEGFQVNHKRVERNLARGRAQGSSKAAKAGPPLVKRWFLCSASADPEEPCLVV